MGRFLLPQQLGAKKFANASGYCASPRGMTKAEFERLTPYERGAAVYMLGAREDEPHVNDESNPYSAGGVEWKDWIRGQAMAVQGSVE